MAERERAIFAALCGRVCRAGRHSGWRTGAMATANASHERSGDAVFRDTMADMTYPEIEAAARDGAVVLWAMGVIEQHGPHLPLATDVYIPSAVLRRARAILAAKGVPSVIAPAFYWGVNHVTGRFPGSFQVRPEVMIELI